MTDLPSSDGYHAKKALLSLGSNLGNRDQYLQQARTMIAERYPVLRMSRTLNNEALIIADQPDFLNQIVEIQMTDTPSELLSFLKSVEVRLGRMHRERYGPREIDLDILAFEGEEMQTGTLNLPHPGLVDRGYLHILLSEPPFGTAEKELHVSAALRSIRRSPLSVLLLLLLVVPLCIVSPMAPLMADPDKKPVTVLPSPAEAAPVIESGSFFYASPGPTDSREQKAYTGAIRLLYQDFQSDFKSMSAQNLEGSILNDLAILASSEKDPEAAESLFRLSLLRNDTLPVRLNLIFLYLSEQVPEAETLLDELRRKLSEERKLVVLRALRIRRLDHAAQRFLRAWIQQNGDRLTPFSPPLLSGAKETATLLALNPDRKAALNLYREIDSRSGGTDSEVIFALAILTEEVEENSDLAISLYRRLFTLGFSDDEALRRYASLQFQKSEYSEASKALKELKDPGIADIRMRIRASLRLDPDTSVEPLIRSAAELPFRALQSPTATLFPAAAQLHRVEDLPPFDGLLQFPALIIQRQNLPDELRYDYFGSIDPVQIEKDRSVQRKIY